jgi:hypothetical protein
MKTIRRIVVGAVTIASLLGGAGVAAAAVGTGTATAAAHQAAAPDAMMAY